MIPLVLSANWKLSEAPTGTQSRQLVFSRRYTH
jgi:hypothetical protein